MVSMVTLERDDAVTRSSVLAEGVGNDHNAVVQLIRTHENHLRDLGTFQVEIEKTKGRPREVYILNEPQAYFLITLMRNSEQVIRFKKELIKAFMEMRKVIIQLKANHQNQDWQQARLDGKAMRKETTDAIKDFTEYAIGQGSKNALMYYSNITRMENKALFIMEQKFPNLREVLNHQQLATLRVVDKMVSDTLQEGMEKDMNYKDIFKLARDRVEQLAMLIKPTIVISATEVKLIE